MSKLFEIIGNSPQPFISYSNYLHKLHRDRQQLGSISNIALFVSLVSAVVLDTLSIILVLLPFCDGGLISAYKIFGKLGEPDLVHRIYAQILFTGILFATLPLSLLIKRANVLQSVHSWNLVGIALQLSTLPYARTSCLLALVSRMTVVLCIKAVLADITLDHPLKDQQLKAPK